ncbi:MAG: hypothetical protein IT299_05900 [Dehalococcoidia bacterium]|nr:hypothetical protein [Dehalococcoidia bacterium]
MAVCDRAIADARQRGDADTVARVSLLAAVVLDTGGRLEEALARIDFGLLAAPAGSEAHAHLWLTRAGFLAIAGRIGEARDSLDRAARGGPADPSDRARVERLTYRSHVSALALDELALVEAHAAVAEAQRAGLDWLATGLVAWLVPWFGAHGLVAAASPWVDWLRALALEVHHRHREEDALASQLIIAATMGGHPLEARPALGNQYAAWRLDLLALRDALFRGANDSAGEVLADLEARVADMSPGFRDGVEAFRALVQAFAGLELVSIQRPEATSLVTLPAILAGAEAAAIGATRGAAAAWAEVLDGLPSRVVTSFEWPSSVARLRGLLALRSGDLVGAARAMRAAVNEATRRGAPLEVALAAVQLDQLRAVTHVGHDAPSVEEAHRTLEAAGLSVEVVRHPIERTLARAPQANRLTPREVEVLAGLEAGLSYREIGDRLGMGWRTAQTHAHHIYRKLEASGRHAAVREARSRRII